MSEPKAKKLCCGWCKFEAGDGAAFVDHMVETGHAVPAEVREDLRGSAKLRAEFAKQMDELLANPEVGIPITEEEAEEMELEHPEVAEQIQKFEEKEAAKRRVN
jgi:hypothetical protein